MSVRIRLKRVGRPKRSYYRVVVIDIHKKRDGRPIEVLGQYDPVADDNNKLKIDRQRLDYWLKCGARPSPTVASLLKKADTSAALYKEASQG